VVPRLERKGCLENESKREAFSLTMDKSLPGSVPVPHGAMANSVFFKSLGMFHGSVPSSEFESMYKTLYAFREFLENHEIPLKHRNLLLRTVVETRSCIRS